MKSLVGKTEGKRPIRTSRRKLADNIKTDSKEIRCEGVNRLDIIKTEYSGRLL
jgi:hypothetical protein